MPKDNENIRLTLDGPDTAPEAQCFRPDQMVRCDECLRANPPTRVSCLYCAIPLPVTESSQGLRMPALRPPEAHEPAYNNIFLPRQQTVLSETVVSTAAELLKLPTEEVRAILSAGMSLPLARTTSREEAELVRERLGQLDLDTTILADDDLGLQDINITRVHCLQLEESGFRVPRDHRTEGVAISWSDFLLIVLGRLLVKRVEVKEYKSRKSENEILEASEFHTDEVLVDFYVARSSQTWRISTTKFDFSCLRDEKTLIANENIGKLVKLIASNAPQADLDDFYNSSREQLDAVWRCEQQRFSSGWRRERPGKYSLAATTIDTNESQFNKYSRMRFYFAPHEQS